MNQLGDELHELVSTERLASIILYALLVEKHPIIKQHAIRDPELGLEHIENKGNYLNNGK